MKLAALGKRNTLWVGFVAVLVPLAVLLAFQYRWLRELDSFSERAQKAQVESLLEAVSKNVEYFYTDAGQVLDLQPAIFTQNQLDHAAYQFKKKGVVGVKRLFVMDLRDGDEPLYFSPSCASFYQPDSTPEARAVAVAVAPWKALYHKDGILERVRLFVEEKDPRLPHPPLPGHRRLLAAGRPRRHGPRRGLLPAGRAAGGHPRRALRLRRQRPGLQADPLRPGRPGADRLRHRSARGAPRLEHRGPAAVPLRLHRLERRARHPARHRRRGGAAELPGQHGPVGGARRRPPRRPHARPAHRGARDEAVADEERVRLQRLPRAAHAAGLDPRLRRVPPPRALRQHRQGPRVRRLHRDREPPPDPAGRQHPRFRQHRVRPQDLPLRALRRRRGRPRHPEDLRGAAAAGRLRHPDRGRRTPRSRRRGSTRGRSSSRSPTCSTTRSSTPGRRGTSSSRSTARRTSSSSPSATRGSASRATSSARSSTASTA